MSKHVACDGCGVKRVEGSVLDDWATVTRPALTWHIGSSRDTLDLCWQCYDSVVKHIRTLKLANA